MPYSRFSTMKACRLYSAETWQTKAGDGEIGSHPEISGYLDD